MKIAMFGHKQIPSREGGVEIVVEELATGMVERGHSVTCYNRKSKRVRGQKKNRVREYEGIKIQEVFTINRKGIAAMTSSLIASIKAGFGRFQLVHIHAEGPAFFCFIPHLLGKKVIVTIHGLDWNRAKWGGFAKWYIKAGEKNAVKFADEMIVLSEGLKEYFLKEYGREVTFIPNGVRRPIHREIGEIEKYGLKKDGYILYLGRIVPEKGEDYLVKAFRELATDKKLVIAGGISDSDAYSQKLKKLANGDDRIVFTGFVEGRVLEELYSNALIYCLPSDLEGMPLSLLEALSYGNCCVVSDIAECTEVVGDKAVVFRKSDVDDLKDKLSDLLENREKIERYRKDAADYVCNKYIWDDVVERTLRLYEKVL